MPAIKLNAFGGMVPAQDDRLLSDQMSAYAENTWLYSGALQGMRELKLVRTCVNTGAKRAFRIPKDQVSKDYIVDSYWLEFNRKDVDVVKAPMDNDVYGRFYWAGEADSNGFFPRYNSRSRIAAGDSYYKLGVPAPTVAPGVTPPGSGSGSTTSRAYVYTWVTGFAEESPPSPATVVTGYAGSWAITMTSPGSSVTTLRNITTTRIYRTVTSSLGAATYFFVAEVPVATLSYTDTITDTVVSSNNQLESTYWSPPPDGLEGMIAMPNGMIAGFVNNEIWFCEPFRPHAWPAIYTLSVDYNIVGLGVMGQTLIVCTESATYACTGVNPSSMSLSVIATTQPCLSRGGIVSTLGGVLYPSPDGISAAVPTGVQVVTKSLISRDQWASLLRVPRLFSALLSGAYYTFGTQSEGCFQNDTFQSAVFELTDFTGSYTGAMIDPTNERTSYVALASDVSTMSVFNDPWTGEVLILRDGKVYHFDVESGLPQTYTWKSKVFQVPYRRNLEALKIYFDVPDGVTGDLGTIRLYADDTLVWSRALLTSGVMMRLPSGFKAEFWQVEVETRVTVWSIQMATSAKELASV